MKIEASIPTRLLGESGGNFALLDQKGSFAMLEDPGRPEIISWFNNLSLGNRMEFHTARSNIYKIFGVNNLFDIKRTLANPDRAETRIQSNRQIATLYGLSGSDTEIAEKIGEYAALADKTIIAAKTTLGSANRGFTSYEISNEVALTGDPLELIGLTFDKGKAIRVRFEALRKIILMMLAAGVDQKDREEAERRLVATTMGKTREERDQQTLSSTENTNYYQFQKFLDEFVFKSHKTGSTQNTVLSSQHGTEDFECTSVHRLPQRQAEIARYRRPPKGTKYTEIQERSFLTQEITQDGRKDRAVSVYSTPREKDPVSTLLKLVRKGQTNPGGVEDSIGLMAVLENRDDIYAFIKRLNEAASEAGLLFHIEELEDTLDGKPYSAKNAGSSTKLRAIKFIARIGGMKIEFLTFDHQGYVENLYRDDVSHDEFAIRRFYKSGAAEWLFPKEIYGVDHVKQERSIRENLRRHIRGH